MKKSCYGQVLKGSGRINTVNGDRLLVRYGLGYKMWLGEPQQKVSSSELIAEAT
jgi:hypothetical protein